MYILNYNNNIYIYIFHAMLILIGLRKFVDPAFPRANASCLAFCMFCVFAMQRGLRVVEIDRERWVTSRLWNAVSIHDSANETKCCIYEVHIKFASDFPQRIYLYPICVLRHLRARNVTSQFSYAAPRRKQPCGARWKVSSSLTSMYTTLMEQFQVLRAIKGRPDDVISGQIGVVSRSRSRR